MLNRGKAQTCAAQRIDSVESLFGVLGAGGETTFVKKLRCEGAHIGMETACFGQEYALVRGYRCATVQQVTKSRDLGTQRMQSPLRLIELLRIAKQDNAG